MVKKTIGACAIVFAALIGVSSAWADACPDDLHWKWKYDQNNGDQDPTLGESYWHSYCDAANWTQKGTGENPGSRYPTDNDILYYGATYHGMCAFDMGENDITVYGIDDTYTREPTAEETAGLWGYHKFMVRNGSLTINNCLTNTRAHFNVWSGGAVKLSDSCKSQLGYQGAQTRWFVHDGGYARAAGEADFSTFMIDVFEGGTMDVEFTRLTHTTQASVSRIVNQGDINFPKGLVMTQAGGYWSILISQQGGTMTIGGDFSRPTAQSGYFGGFYLAGGKVDFTGSSTLIGYTQGMISNTAPVVVNVASGKTADYRVLEFESGAQLTKNGEGMFIVGSGAPASVAVTAGGLGVAGAVNFGSGLTLASGTTLRFYGGGASATAINGLAEATVDIDPDLSDGTKVFASTDDTLRSAVLAKLQTSSGSIGNFSVSGNDIVLTRSHVPSVFYWNGGFSNWKNFADANNWGVGTTPEATNPDRLIPGATDWLHYMFEYSFTIMWDLGNSHHTIKGFDFTNWPITDKSHDPQWGPWGFHKFYLRNGTLEISQNFTNQRVTVSLESNAKFILGPNSHTRLSQGDAQSWYTVKSGCEMVMGGYLELVIPMIEVEAGGKLSFEPKELTANVDSFRTVSDHPNGYVRNYGTMDFPNGINFLSGGNESTPGTLTFENYDGTMTFGGSIVKGEAAYGVFNLYFHGGTMVFNQDTDIRWFTNAGSTNLNSTTTVQVASGKTLKLPGGSYAEGSKIVKTGEGSIAFGTGLPNAVEVAEGDLTFAGANSTLNSLTMTSGTTLTINCPGTTINSFTGYDKANFVVNAANLSVGSVVLKSSNNTMLAALKNKAVLPTGYYLEHKSGSGRLTLQNDSLGYVFNCQGEKSMSDPTGWLSGSVAPAGADVFIKGEKTVAVLDNTMPVYNSIRVLDGGTLKLKNLTTIPTLSVLYQSKVIVAEGTELSIAKEQITFEADASAIPELQIAADARATFARGHEFKNVNLVLWGTLQCEPPFFFGTAGAGETTYFNLAATNATIDIVNTNSNQNIYWMAPQDASGRVVSSKGISLRSVTFVRPNSGLLGNFVGCYTAAIGNPKDEVFNMILDNTSLPISYNSAHLIGAGARIKVVNGGAVEKGPKWVSSPGTYGHPYFVGDAQLTFEGANAWFGYYYNRHYAEINPDESGYNQMTFRNGASLRVPHFTGNGKAVFTFENAFFDVPELPGYDRAMWGGWVYDNTTKTYKWYSKNGGGDDIPPGVVIEHSELCKTNYFSPAFRGLKEVNITQGYKLGFRGVNWFGINSANCVPNSETSPSKEKEIPYSNEWNRVIWTDDQVPITGGGSIYVCNTVSNQSMAAIIRCGSNTATGNAWAEEDTVGNGNMLYFADGANWAGTVIVNERLGLTNVSTTAQAAKVKFNNLSFESPLGIRVWRDSAGLTNDCVTITSSSFKPQTGCIEPVPMAGYTPKLGDTFVIAELPSGVPSMSGRDYLTNHRWLLSDEVDSDSVRRVKLRYVPGGILLNFRGAPPEE